MRERDTEEREGEGRREDRKEKKKVKNQPRGPRVAGYAGPGQDETKDG